MDNDSAVEILKTERERHERMARVRQNATNKNRKNWTIMVYLGGDNNLAEEMVYALKTMYSVGTTDGCSIYALYDAGLGPVTFPIPTREERLDHVLEKLRVPDDALVFLPDRRPLDGPIAENNELLRRAEELRSKVFKGNGVPEVASVQSMLTNFIKSCVYASPARHYMLVLSGHGTGSAGDFLAANKRFGGLSIPDLRETLRSVAEDFEGVPELYRKMDILGMDSCQMSTAEVAYEVREYVDFVVGAEGFEPNTGWPYDQMLARLNKRIQEAKSEEKVLQAARKATDGKQASEILAEIETIRGKIQDILAGAMRIDPETVVAPPNIDKEAHIAAVRKRIAKAAAVVVVANAIAERAAFKAAQDSKKKKAPPDEGQIGAAAENAARQILTESRDRIFGIPSGRSPTAKSALGTAAAAVPAREPVQHRPPLRASRLALRAARREVATATSRAEILESAEEAAREHFLKALREEDMTKVSLDLNEEDDAKRMAWKAVTEAIASDAAESALGNPPVFPKPIGLAAGIVREYVKFYSSDYTLADVSTDLSALDLSKTNRLAELLQSSNGLSQLMIDALAKDGPSQSAEGNAIILAHWEAQGYKDEQNVDLWDFCECLRARCELLGTRAGVGIANACQQVKDAIDELVVSSGYCGPAFQHSHGLSVFFPWTSSTDAAGVQELDHYRTLDFALDTRWDAFLETYTRATQRKGRATTLGLDVHKSTLNRRDFLFLGEPEDSATNGEIILPDGEVTVENGQLDNPEILIGEREEKTVRKGAELTVRGDVIRVRDGRVTVRDGRVTVRDGRVTVRDGRVTVRDGRVTVRDGRVTVRDGEDLNVGDGRVTVRDGRVTVRDGRVTVRDGLVTVRDGEDLNVRDGRVTVRDGRLTVRDGRVIVRRGEELIVRDGRVTVRVSEVTAPDGQMVRDGRVTVRDGRVTVRDGRVTVRDGRVTVRDGRVTVRDGRVTVREGNGLAVRDGRVTVRDGRVTVRGGGLGTVTKIASMKNPPFSWQDCDLMAKGLKQSSKGYRVAVLD